MANRIEWMPYKSALSSFLIIALVNIKEMNIMYMFSILINRSTFTIYSFKTDICHTIP